MKEVEGRTIASSTKIAPAFAARLREQNEVKAQLKKRIKEYDVRIERMQLELRRTNWEFSNHDDPMNRIDGLNGLRKGRPDKEHIDDDATIKLQEHREALQQNHRELQARIKEDSAALKILISERDELQEDLDEKQHAFNI